MRLSEVIRIYPFRRIWKLHQADIEPAVCEDFRTVNACLLSGRGNNPVSIVLRLDPRVIVWDNDDFFGFLGSQELSRFFVGNAMRAKHGDDAPVHPCCADILVDRKSIKDALDDKDGIHFLGDRRFVEKVVLSRRIEMWDSLFRFWADGTAIHALAVHHYDPVEERGIVIALPTLFDDTGAKQVCFRKSTAKQALDARSPHR